MVSLFRLMILLEEFGVGLLVSRGDSIIIQCNERFQLGRKSFQEVCGEAKNRHMTKAASQPEADQKARI
jgi:hypothetical protein